MPVNRSFVKLQKERNRQEKAAAKRKKRSERRRGGAEGTPGAGPPIDYSAGVGNVAVDDEEGEQQG